MNFVLGFFDPGDVLESDLVLITRKHLGLALAKTKSAFSCHPDLLTEQNIKDDQENNDRRVGNQSHPEQIRLGLDGHFKPCILDLLLKIAIEIHENISPELWRFNWSRSIRSWIIITTQILRGPAFLDDEFQGMLFIHDQLMLTQKLLELRERLLIAWIIETRRNQSQGDQGKCDNK